MSFSFELLKAAFRAVEQCRSFAEAFGSVTCPASVWQIISVKRSRAVASYVLCAHRRWAPAVTPKMPNNVSKNAGREKRKKIIKFTLPKMDLLLRFHLLKTHVISEV